MLLTRYSTAAAFLERAQTDLERQEAANNLMIGIAIRLKEQPDRVKAQPYLATVEADGVLPATLAAAVMTPPHRVIVHAANADTAPLRLLVEDLAAGGWVVPGTIGPAQVAHAFAEVWTATRGGHSRLHTHERVYELRQVTPPAAVSGALRFATEADVALVSAWVYAFMQDAGLGGTVEGAREIAELRIADRDICLWEDGQPVSMAAKTRHTTHGIAVSLVYTPPVFRRHGYAGACVAGLSQRLLDAGWQFCALFTDLANPTSNSVYQKIGYRPVSDFDEYVFE